MCFRPTVYRAWTFLVLGTCGHPLISVIVLKIHSSRLRVVSVPVRREGYLGWVLLSCLPGSVIRRGWNTVPGAAAWLDIDVMLEGHDGVLWAGAHRFLVLNCMSRIRCKHWQLGAKSVHSIGR